MTNKERVMHAWSESLQFWPPAIGDKVKVFQPKEFRGRVAKVIAVGAHKTTNSTRKAPKGKARITVSGYQWAVAQHDVFPYEFKLKDLQAL